MSTTIFIYNELLLINGNPYNITDLLKDASPLEVLRNTPLTICVAGTTLKSMYMFGYLSALASTKVTKYMP